MEWRKVTSQKGTNCGYLKSIMGEYDASFPIRRGLPTRIAALLYDFDDTIVESERINDSLFADVLRSDHGISLTEQEQTFLYGLSWGGVFDWLKKNRGLQADRPEVWEGFLARKERLLSTRKLRVAAGIRAMFALPTLQAIVSGSTRGEIRMMMENIGMRPDVVRFVICEEDCERGKPDPEGYRLALHRLGVRPSNAVAFEDSPPGLQAARSAGIVSVFVAELASRDSAAYADVSFASFAEAETAIRGRIGTSGPL
jgi:beta-phosphoglucomutase-like phosphatase (HAD superfamily)